jgi:hypothetical protein
VNRVGQRLLAATAAGAAAFNYPLLAAAEVDGRVVGVPVLYVYLFTAWTVMIAAMALIIERRG